MYLKCFLESVKEDNSWLNYLRILQDFTNKRNYLKCQEFSFFSTIVFLLETFYTFVLSDIFNLIKVKSNQKSESARGYRFPFQLFAIFFASTKFCLFGSKVFLRYEMFA